MESMKSENISCNQQNVTELPSTQQSEILVKNINNMPSSSTLVALASSQLIQQSENDNEYLLDINGKLKNENESLHQQINQLKLALLQKDGVLALYEREKNILEKEKLALKKHVDQAIKEKENIVIKFATKEKYLLDAKKEKETFEKLLNDSKKEIKNLTTKYQTLNDEKSRLLNIIDEKCNEIKKHLKDNEKLKTDVNNLEMKLKWNTLKLAQETEGKIAAEKKLEECHNVNTVKTEEKQIALSEQQRMEQEANLILLKHNNEKKDKEIEIFKKKINKCQIKLLNYKISLIIIKLSLIRLMQN